MDRKFLTMALMYANEGTPIEGRTRLQKLVFLLQKQLENEEIELGSDIEYEFVPYDYGPFSKELYADLDQAVLAEMVAGRKEDIDDEVTKYEYRIKKKGERWFEAACDSTEKQQILQIAEDVKSEYGDMLLSDLIDEVYSRFPRYAENSIY